MICILFYQLLGRRRNLEFKKAGYNIEISAPLDNIPLSTSSGRERVDVPVWSYTHPTLDPQYVNACNQ